jgi:uncharacterized membrane protein
MDLHAATVVFFRWLHLAAACVAVGGAFFVRFVFTQGQKELDAQTAADVLIRTRRAFKMVIHSCILLLVISGSYNAVLNWPAYTAAGPGLGHGLFGLHLLLALLVFAIALWLLAGEPKPTHRKWLTVNVVLMFLTIAAASTVKFAREHAQAAANAAMGIH